MQFSDTSTRQGLIQDCEDLCNLGAAGISGTTALLQTFTRYINQWYYKSIAWILEASSTWEWDDSNYSNFPIATATLVDNQEDYSLPQAAASSSNDSTFLKLTGISVKDAGGVWYKLRRIDESQARNVDLEEVYKTKGRPLYYKEIGSSVKLLPAPSSTAMTLTSGLKVYYQRTMDEFATTDTTQQPGFAAPFHRILSLGASYDYGVARGLENAPALRGEIEQLQAELKKFYSDKNKDEKISMTPTEAHRRIRI